MKSIIQESLGFCVDPDYEQSKSGHALKEHKFGIQDCARFDPTGGYRAAYRDVQGLLLENYHDPKTLDPFSGRGLIPLEAARYGVSAYAIDYSPVASLASRLLTEYPFRDWDDEPPLPLTGYDSTVWQAGRTSRLHHDVSAVIDEVQSRWYAKVAPYFPDSPTGGKPWGYIWAATVCCEECRRRFPLFGSNVLRYPSKKSRAQSFELDVSPDGSWRVRIVDGLTTQLPTSRAQKGRHGKSAWCPYDDCGHGHPHRTVSRMSKEDFANDVLMVVADLDGKDKVFRAPTSDDLNAASFAWRDMATRGLLSSGLPARPDEEIPPANSTIIAGSTKGAVTFGDLSNERQNLVHAELSETIGELGHELVSAGISPEYVQCLTGYLGAVLVKKLRFSTRGAALGTFKSGGVYASDIFTNESTVGYNYDYFETGILDGPGTWKSVSAGALRVIEKLSGVPGAPADVRRASALRLPFRDSVFDAVVTDPPYDQMISYSDASDLFYVWLRRALSNFHPELSVTANQFNLQEKDEEAIVKKDYRMWDGEHRTPQHYDDSISQAFAECRRTVKPEGVVTIVFGHGEPEVWKRLLTSIDSAGLVLTGSWPASTEKGGSAGSANIVTTLTLACRPAPPNRSDGRVAEVDAEVRRVVADRVKNLWDPAGLAVDDQLMAAAGPAMEVVGRYAQVLDKTGKPVDISRYLPLARRAVEDAQDIRLDSLPLATFDTRTRFGLFWARLHGRRAQAASEARWQRLAADMEEHETAGVLTAASKGVRLAYSDEAAPRVEDGSPIFDVALAAAHEWRTGSLAEAASTLRASGRDPDDPHLWACINALSKALPETDKDGEVFTRMVRTRESVVAAARNVEAAELEAAKQSEQHQQREKDSPRLFKDPNSLFGQEGL